MVTRAVSVFVVKPDDGVDPGHLADSQPDVSLRPPGVVARSFVLLLSQALPIVVAGLGLVVGRIGWPSHGIGGVTSRRDIAGFGDIAGFLSAQSPVGRETG